VVLWDVINRAPGAQAQPTLLYVQVLASHVIPADRVSTHRISHGYWAMARLRFVLKGMKQIYLDGHKSIMKFLDIEEVIHLPVMRSKNRSVDTRRAGIN
jgi:hypothetical protein